jgi:peptide/nickel transport system substrate-binding protein
VPAEQAPQLSKIAGTQVYRYPFSRFADLGFNAGRPPLSDIRVRQALAYGTDVPALIALAAHGQYIQADGDQPPWRWSYNPAAKRYPYDPKLADRLLDVAGWRLGPDGMRYKNGQLLQLSLVGQVDDATAVRSEAVLQQQWRALGIDVRIRNFTSSILYALGSGIEQSGKFDVGFEGWTETVDPDNAQLYGCRMAPPNGWNVYHFCDPAIERAELIGRGSFDPSARKQAYAQIEDEVETGLPFYVLWFVRQEDLVNSDLRGYRPGKTLSAYWNVWQWSI